MTYRENICPESPSTVYCEDVRTLAIDQLDPIDIFAYGFPCNDFSNVGERKGFDGVFGPLYTYGLTVLDTFKPKVFVAENVSGLKSSNNGDSFRTILRDLERAGDGYKITAHLFRFEEYGVPQTRHRIIIVGFCNKLKKEFRVPAPTTVSTPVTARQALEDPPIEPTAKNQELTRQSAIVRERLSYIRPGENVWQATLPDHLRLNVKAARLSHIYKRLHPDKPAYTVTGSGGGGTHTYHWSEARALTNRERARLQTFPDDFVFHGSKESVRKQIGMAVPPIFSHLLFESILKSLAGIDYESVAPSIHTINEPQLKLM